MGIPFDYSTDAQEALSGSPEDMSDEKYLCDLARRIHQIPTVHGVDGYDVDRLKGIARRMTTSPRKAKP